MYFVASVVFIASILIPFIKILSLFILLISIQTKSIDKLRQKTRLYRFVIHIGRWSMIDVFVVAFMVSVVNLGEVLQIHAGPAVAAFASVVILTIFAVNSLDIRLLWDSCDE